MYRASEWGYDTWAALDESDVVFCPISFRR